jgi:luciferase family oxidoreductase group 1
MVEDLIGFLHGGLKEPHPLAGIKVQPGESDGTTPEVWLLGSSDYSARLAAAIGLPFSFADFFGNTGEHGPQVAEIYRNAFQPSIYLSEPRVNVALQVICARTEAEARFIGASRSLNKMVSALGLTTNGLLPPEEAIKWPMDDETKAYMSLATKSYIEGDLDQVRAGIIAASKRYHTSDIGIVTNCYDFEHRKRSYALVAECMELTPSESDA